MISIDNKKIDLIFQVEEHAKIHKLFDRLTLDTENILIICPTLFLQRFIQDVHEDICNNITFESLEDYVNHNPDYLRLIVHYKRSYFKFYFVVTSTESTTINNPFKGEQTFNIGFKEIKT